MYTTTPGKIIAAKKYFDENPNGLINTGMWTQPTWSKENFYRWFRRCLHLKTGGRPMTDKDHDLQADYRRVQDYKQRRAVTHGRNLMRTKLFSRLYPELHNRSQFD